MDFRRSSAELGDPMLFAARLGFDDPRGASVPSLLAVVQPVFSPWLVLAIEDRPASTEVILAWEPNGIAGGEVSEGERNRVWDAVGRVDDPFEEPDGTLRDGTTVLVATSTSPPGAVRRTHWSEDPMSACALAVLQVVRSLDDEVAIEVAGRAAFALAASGRSGFDVGPKHRWKPLPE